jgi:hypothetical protein
MIMSLSTICSGKDKFAKRYMSIGIEMGEHLGLFGEQRRTPEQCLAMPETQSSMLSFVAWGAFNLSW